MSAKWTAQEPPRKEWNERHGTRFAVDVLDEKGQLVATAYGETAAAAWQRGCRIERRAA